MKRWLLWIAERNAFVAWAAGSLSIASFLWLEASIDWPLIVLIAAGAFLVYHFDRVLPFSPEDRNTRPRRAPLLGFLAASLLMAAAAWRAVDADLWPGLVTLVVLAGGYLLPCLPGRRRLKEIPLLKAILVAWIWALATVWLPAADDGRATTVPAIYLTVYRFVYLAPNTLLFDWPDRDGDREAGIVTWAHLLGESGLRRLCIFITWLAVGLSLAGPGCFGFSRWLLLENIGSGISLILLRRPLPDGAFFYRVLLDGLAAWPVVPALGMILIGGP